MKNWIYSAVGAFLMSPVLFGSCDEVDEADRYIEVEQIVPKRTVLLEEFTGQWCMNCPSAHAIVNSLKEQYGESFISVSIHAGGFGIAEGSLPGIPGLMQPEGDEYAAKWNVSAFPAGVLDRRSGAMNADQWAAAIRDELTRETNLALNVKADTTTSADSVTVTVDLTPASDINGKLQIWITESNITALQQNGNNIDLSYVHNHVYRASVNGTWGEDMILSDNVLQTVRRQIKIKDNWVKKNLSVVAFVYNDAEGVLQAAESKVN